VTTRVVKDPSHGELRDALSHDWYPLLEGLGITPLLVPNLEDAVADYLSGIDLRGLILTGGNNLCPETYHLEDTGVPDTSFARDRTESLLIESAISSGLPILGVCRGMHILNTHFGGRLLPDLSRTASESHVACEHEVEILRPDWIEQFGWESLRVNSFHDQGLTEAELSRELTCFAKTGAGIIEGLVHAELPIVGIQWHPERKNPAADFDRALLDGLFLKEDLGAVSTAWKPSRAGA
jgi:putative glutamine amidotransferase